MLDELNVKSLQFVSSRDQVGCRSACEGNLVVGLDMHLNEELVLEGIARDLVRHVQNLRKRAGLRVDQRIALWVAADGQVGAAVRRFGDYLAAETLAAEVADATPPAHAIAGTCRVAGEPVRLGLAAAAEGC